MTYTVQKDKDGGWWVMEGAWSYAYCRIKESAEYIAKLLNEKPAVRL